MTTKKSRSTKEKRSNDYQQISFFNRDDESLRSESSSSVSRGHHSNKRDKDSTYEKDNFQEETDKGIIIAFARQISFSGVEFFFSIQLPANFDLWPQLSQQWKRSEEAHKKGTGLSGKTWNG